MIAPHHPLDSTTALTVNAKGGRLPRLLPLLLVGIMLATTFLVWRLAIVDAQSAAQIRFEERASDALQTVVGRLSDSEKLLLGSAQLLGSHKSIPGREWRRFVTSLRLRMEGPVLEAIGFAPYVLEAEREEFLSQARAGGASNYAILPPGLRQAYAPILLLESAEAPDLRLAGVDLLSGDFHRAAMDEAVVRGAASVAVVPPGPDPAAAEWAAGAVWMYVPVYRNSAAADSVEARRASLSGYAFSRLRLVEWWRAAPKLWREDVVFRIYLDQDAPNPVLVFSGSGAQAPVPPDPATAKFQLRRTVDCYGQKWVFVMGSTHKFDSSLDHTRSALVLVAGLLISLLSAGITFTIQTRREHAVRLAQEIVAKLGVTETRYQTLLELGSDGIHVLDADGKLHEYSRSFLHMLGYTAEEIIHMNVREWDAQFDPNDCARIIGELMAAPRVFQTKHRRKDGTLIDVEINACGIEIHGRPFLYASARDLTERNLEQQALAEQGIRLRLLVDQSRDGIAVLAEDGRVMEVNAKLAEMLGYTTEEALRHHLWDWDAQWTREELLDQLQRMDPQGAFFETRCRRKDGTLIDLEISANAAVVRGRKLVFAVCRDLAPRKVAEARTAASLSLLQATLESTVDGILVVSNEGRITAKNRRFAELWRVPSALLETLDDQANLGFVMGQLEDAEEFRARVQELYRDPEKESMDLLRFKDGRQFERFSRPQRLGVQVVGRVWSFRDVTERERAGKALRESEAKFRSYVENAPVGVAVMDSEGRYVEVNAAAENMLGYEPGGLLGSLVPDLFAPEDAEESRRHFARLQERGVLDGILRLRRRDGQTLQVSVRAVRLSADRYMAIFLDLTRQMLVEKELRELVAAKTALLMELHHRVKNNLQIMTSLVNLQRRKVSHPDALAALAETQARIRAMSLLHETLYRSARLDKVEMSEYLRELCQNLERVYGTIGRGIALTTKLEPIAMHMDQAVPCGLILNELISNAFKHAFPCGRRGDVLVEFESLADGDLFARVSDNGIGFPAAEELGAGNTLGLTLVADLAKQMAATLQVRRENGTRFELRFSRRARDVEPALTG